MRTFVHLAKTLILGAAVLGIFFAISGFANFTAGHWGETFNHEGSFERTLTVNGPVRLQVQTGAGSVHVTRGDAQRVSIVAHIRGRSEERVRAIEQNPPVVQHGNEIEIGKLSREAQRDISISYEVRAPQQTELQTASGSGNIVVADLDGPVSASTGSGGLTISGVQHGLTATTGSGNVHINHVAGALTTRAGSGSIEVLQSGAAVKAQSGSGNVTVDGAGGAVDAQTGSGSIKLNGIHSDLTAHTGSGHIRAAGSMPSGSRWNLEAASGSIDLDLPTTTAAEVSAHTGSGTVTTSLPITLTGAVNHHDLHGVIKSADAQLTATTGSGNIRID